LKITFLGTGTSQGIPVIACKCKICNSDDLHDKRLRSSVFIEDNDSRFVIDAGPDFRQQLLREHVTHLNAVIFTHEHKDHIAGLDDIRAFNYISKKPVDIYAEQRVQEALVREYSYVFAEKRYPGIPQMILHNIENMPFKINNTPFVPIRVFHYHLPIFGYRIHDFCYITDANFIPEAEKEKLFGIKVLVINALRKEKHVSHFNLSDAISLAAQLKPVKTYITHISHMMGLHREIENDLPVNIFLAYDGLSLET
jgi:phosphoribosyl 1,2-cyclic phosphate phosphodiesterase